jgi:hypothetical protein
MPYLLFRKTYTTILPYNNQVDHQIACSTVHDENAKINPPARLIEMSRR